MSRLPQGCVVLPGLDQQLDDESWLALGEQHPQFGMRELLKVLQVNRKDVALLPHLRAGREGGPARERWLRDHAPERDDPPVEDREGPDRYAAAGLAGLTLLEAPEMREQALMIALTMRKALEEERRCALVTPDRQLAGRVSAELARWNIYVDDSAGEPLSMQPHGVFFKLWPPPSSPMAGRSR